MKGYVPVYVGPKSAELEILKNEGTPEYKIINVAYYILVFFRNAVWVEFFEKILLAITYYTKV